jgi:hypothetical protein
MFLQHCHYLFDDEVSYHPTVVASQIIFAHSLDGRDGPDDTTTHPEDEN